MWLNIVFDRHGRTLRSGLTVDSTVNIDRQTFRDHQGSHWNLVIDTDTLLVATDVRNKSLHIYAKTK